MAWQPGVLENMHATQSPGNKQDEYLILISLFFIALGILGGNKPPYCLKSTTSQKILGSAGQ
jgi:hypothetical protein